MPAEQFVDKLVSVSESDGPVLASLLQLDRLQRSKAGQGGGEGEGYLLQLLLTLAGHDLEQPSEVGGTCTCTCTVI